MKKFIIFLFIAVLGYSFYDNSYISPQIKGGNHSQGIQLLSNAYKNRISNIQIQGTGKVIRMLPDDNKGSRHQKFIIKLSSGQTLLISHNIDLAPRINSLTTGDTIDFYGEYEWNSKGGVIHWTHNDPRGLHENGWLKHKGTIYQ